MARDDAGAAGTIVMSFVLGAITGAALAQQTIRKGVGRSKGYGCGMMRISPASAARAAA